MKTATIVLIAILFSGCAQTEAIVRNAKPFVDAYCLQAPEARALVRGEVNLAIAPNTVRITCANDPV